MNTPISSARQQQGAAAVAAIGLLFSAILFLVLVVDTGRLYLERRNIQQKADIAAIEAAQVYCSGFTNAASLEQAVATTLRDNDFDPDKSGNGFSIMIGETSLQDFRRQFSSDGEMEAVRVQVSRTIPASIVRGSVFNDITMTAEAVAQRNVVGSLSAGSGTLAVNSSNSPVLNSLIGEMLGGSINLSAASYHGLANSSIKLLGLRDEMAALNLVANAATAQQLLNVSLGMSDWLSVLRAVAQTEDGIPSVAIQALNDIISLNSASGPTGTLNLSDILSIADGASNDELLGSEVALLDMLLNSLLSLNEGNDSSPLQLTINGIGVSLVIEQAPSIAIGRFGYDSQGQKRTVASSSGTVLRVDLGSSLFNSLLSVLPGAITSIQTNFSVVVEAGQGDAWLHGINQCPRLLSREIHYRIGSRSGPARVVIGSTGSNYNAPGALTIRLLGLNINFSIQAILNLQESERLSNILVADLSDTNALPTQPSATTTSLHNLLTNGDVAINLNLETNLGLLDPLGLLGLVNLVTGLVTPLINVTLVPTLATVASLALDPLLEALGISLGQVHYQITGLEEGSGSLEL